MVMQGINVIYEKSISYNNNCSINQIDLIFFLVNACYASVITSISREKNPCKLSKINVNYDSFIYLIQ